jgi:hypothetical protein
MNKIGIGNKEIDQIKDFALKAFHATPQFLDLDAKEMQIACILMGLETFMNARGEPVSYEVKLKKHHDSLPVDESGLGDIE